MISRASCGKSLLQYAKSEVYTYSVYTGVILLVLIPISLILSFYISMADFRWLKLLLLVLFGIPISAPLIYFVYNLVINIIKLQLAKRSEFSIVKATVSRLVRNERPKGVMSRSTYDVIYFVGYGHIIPSQTVFDLTSDKDEFYLVILHNKKREIVQAYHTKRYECKDIDLEKNEK